MTKKEKVEIEIEISEEMAAWLREEAARTGKTIDEIISEAIKQFLIVPNFFNSFGDVVKS